MESMKGTSTGEDIFKCVENAFHKIELSWQKMTSITTDGSPYLTGKKVGLLKRICDQAAEVDFNKELIFLHCIIHHEICQGILDMKHVVDPIVKIVNFIQARGLYHR
ncbi:General transcription factor II-I repeat domain-containing protein 2A [Thelohanellus kitauei]|uniref:General transcription factor II-I repeat domain-containing protein 2A n=1 Tax=Thelohanellus kitauei TaxID=669202 RepID=A0A0C2IYN6_THEKT|nr:General transcription factor II-I repeat domain-containing protein 2A [Thelohanellus kitauei]